MKNKTEIESTSRRSFLRKLGGVGASSALARFSLLSGNMLWARSVFAAQAPKRVIFVYTGGGAIPDEWIPASSSAALPGMSAPLESVRQHCVFLKGVNQVNPGHGLVSKALGSHHAATTLDLHMANTLGQVTPFSLLQLGVRSNGQGSISRHNWNEPPFEDNPLNAFDRLFGAGSSTSLDIETRRKLGVLNCNLEALNQMRSSLGSFEKARLDEHTAAIERIEKRLNAASQASSGGACTTPIFNSNGFSGEANTDVNFDPIADLQCDLITLALKCDLTRVVSFMIGNQACDYIVSEAGVDTNYHASIHGRPIEDYIQYRAYFTSKLAYLIQQLATTDDIDGNKLIDNTILLTVADMADARGHTGEDAPYMLAGGGGGTLTGGRLVTLNGVSHDTILDTVAQAAGVDVNSADYPGFYGEGPISGIFN